MTRCCTSCPPRLATLLMAVVAPWFGGTSRACDTPVYRYAMYRWLPAPYELYCFYDGQPDADSQKVAAAVDRLATREAAPANLVVFSVNVQNDKELAGLLPDIREAWNRQASQQTPWYLVSSPRGVHIFGGTLTADDLQGLVDSPLRGSICQLMEQGKAGVYVLVTSDDQAANERAEQEIRGVIDDVAAGKIPLYTMPGDAADERGSSAAAGARPAQKVEFGLVKVARGDASEKWVLDCLLALDSDLPRSTEPLAFLVYGRGRALFSSLGKGIQRANLTQDVEFITGACSCIVKDENPGVDLLMSYNWNSVAEALAQQFGAEEGSAYRFSGDALFPELIIPVDGPSASKPAAPGSAPASAAPATDSVITTSPAAAAPRSAAAASDPIEPPAEHTPVAAAPAITTAPPSVVVEDAEASPPDHWRAVMWVGGGLVGALLALFGATFLVLRPR
jgi:hypothetical protein